MRNFLLFTALLLSPLFMKAQVFIINSPAELQGAYLYGTADFGAQLTDSVYMGDLMLIDDAVDPVNDGCEQTTQDLTGFWVLIDRGACEFGLKALQAENAGADGVIILNHTPSAGAVGMAAGAVGDQVTIPLLMLSYENGVAIKEVLAMGTTVSVTTGNLVLPNDISTEIQGSSSPLTGTIDQLMWEGLSQTFTPGVRIVNNGLNTATNVSANAVIDFNGTEVYNQDVIASADTIAPGDTIFLPMPDYLITNDDVGHYTVNYTLMSDSTDDLAFDNAAATDFSVSENIICKGSWNFDEGVPNLTSNYRTTAVGLNEYVAGFRTPKAGLILDKVTYNISTNSTTESLANINYQVWLYRWIDADGDMLAQPAELTRVGLAIPNFTDGAPGQAWATDDLIGISEPKVITSSDDSGYFVGIKFADTDSLFVGYNENNNVSFSLEQSLIVNELDVPHHVVTMFDGETPDIAASGVFTDSGFPMAVAIHVAEVTSTEQPELRGQLSLYPNPATDFIQVQLELEELAAEVSYEITDNAGRLLYTVTQKSIQEGNTTFDVSQLAAGTYQMTVKDGKGMKTVSFSKI